MKNERANLEEIFDTCLSIFEKKNHDYNGAFSKRYEKRGIVYCVDKISEKCDRLDSLASKDAKVADESIEDTLLDTINYCAMTLDLLKQDKHGNN